VLDDGAGRWRRAVVPGGGAKRSYRPLNVINPGAKFKRHAQPSPMPQVLDILKNNYFTTG
jgi:hypothetical protein